jgi:hypothetical protein
MNKFLVFCQACSRSRELHYDTLPELREKLKGIGYLINLDTLISFHHDCTCRGGQFLGISGFCPKCNHAPCWADAMGISFEEDFNGNN